MKVLVLASGGLDSTTLLHYAVNQVGKENVIALGLSYGQKHEKELECSLWQTSKLGVAHHIRDLSSVFKFNPDCSALLKGSSKELKHTSYAEQLAEQNGGPVTAYVPFRNGLFLSFATAVALQFDCAEVLYGAHADDAAGSAYPDCTPEFIECMNGAIYHGTGKQIKLSAPLWDKNKADVVKFGLDQGMEYEDFVHTWSCYEGGEKPCGTCGTCRDRKKAFEANGMLDIM